MKIATLCLLVNPNEQSVLLGMKKRGWGQDKWNGFGGKPEINEDIMNAAIREVKEEVGVNVKSIKDAGTLHFKEVGKDGELTIHLFWCEDWDGVPVETEEMKPQLFSFDRIPYDEMWVYDKYWIPLVLDGSKIDAEFIFRKDGGEETLVSYEVKAIGSVG